MGAIPRRVPAGSAGPAVPGAPDVGRPGRRRRPTGKPPPLPRGIHRTGLWWVAAAVVLVTLAKVVFGPARRGLGVAVTVWDDAVVGWLARLHLPGLTGLMEAIMASTGSAAVVGVVRWGVLVALLVLRRFRHLVVFVGSFLAVLLAVRLATVDRPRPFGVELRGSWAGWAMPSRPVAIFAATLVGVLYTLVPAGRWRQLGKWVAAGLVTAFALARVGLGVDAPTDVLVGAVIGVAVSVAAYRLFVPSEVFPVAYRRGRSAHLDVGGRRGEAIREDLVGHEQPVGGNRDRDPDDGGQERVGGGVHAEVDPGQGERCDQAGRDPLAELPPATLRDQRVQHPDQGRGENGGRPRRHRPAAPAAAQLHPKRPRAVHRRQPDRQQDRQEGATNTSRWRKRRNASNAITDPPAPTPDHRPIRWRRRSPP